MESVISVIARLKELKEKLSSEEASEHLAISQGKMGKARANSVIIKLLKKNIAFKTKALKERIFSPILEITYLYQNHQLHARLTNLSKEEASMLLTEFFKIKGEEVKILEIKEIPTFISEVEL